MHRSMKALSLPLTFALSALGTGIAQAAVFSVTTSGDVPVGYASNCSAGQCPTLRDAVAAANATPGSDTIQFGGKFFQQIVLAHGQLNIANSGSLSITGASNRVITISGNSTSRVFHVDPGANLTLRYMTIANGEGGAVGGGIFNNGNLTLDRSTVRNNTAVVGGGIFNAGKLTLTRSTLSNNSASGDGGGIYNYTHREVLVDNSTLSGNSAAHRGGGIANQGDLGIQISTLSGNSATAGGGVSNFAQATTVVFSSALANSPSGLDCTNHSGSSFSFWTMHSLIGSGNNCNANFTGDFKLGPLANNGGTTQTHLPAPDSPLVDQFLCQGLVDQRGVARPQGTACDIGAVEVASPP